MEIRVKSEMFTFSLREDAGELILEMCFAGMDFQ